MKLGGNMTQKQKIELGEARLRELLTKLDTLHPKVIADFKNVPESSQRLYLEVHLAERPQPAKAVKLKCLDCCCWQKTEITHCTVRQCGLWKLRPYQESK